MNCVKVQVCSRGCIIINALILEAGGVGTQISILFKQVSFGWRRWQGMDNGSGERERGNVGHEQRRPVVNRERIGFTLHLPCDNDLTTTNTNTMPVSALGGRSPYLSASTTAFAAPHRTAPNIGVLALVFLPYTTVHQQNSPPFLSACIDKT